MNLIELRTKIENYKPYNKQEKKDKQVMLKYIDTFDNILKRESELAHFTASSWVVNQEKTKVLMIYHNIYQSWAWTGGHSDGEADLLKVAMKELKEETGLEKVKILSKDIFSLEALTVNGHMKNGKYVSSHIHLNLTYLLEVEEKEIIKVQEEKNKKVRWVPLEEVKQISEENWMKENIYAKLNQKLKENSSCHNK